MGCNETIASGKRPPRGRPPGTSVPKQQQPMGEIVEVEGGHIVRSTGRKDRHSKAVDWLRKKAKTSIDELNQLPRRSNPNILQCDVYAVCRPYGSCNNNNVQSCMCVPGFVPKDSREWESGQWTSGCVRKTLSQCSHYPNRTTADGFVELSSKSMPPAGRIMYSEQRQCEKVVGLLARTTEMMDRHVGKHFQIPTGSFAVFSMLALTLFLPIYDRFIVPFSRRMMKDGKGITLLQRMGIGMALTVISMAFAATAERKRRSVALSQGLMEKPGDVIPMSALWLVPQYSVAGLAEAFSAVGEIEFLYSQFPENMRSIAGALFPLSMALGNYLSSLIVSIVHKTTGGSGHHNWLAQDLNITTLDDDDVRNRYRFMSGPLEHHGRSPTREIRFASGPLEMSPVEANWEQDMIV